MHLGRGPGGPGDPVNPSVVMSSTFHQGGANPYGRDGNPTWEALEEVIGGLEGGEALVFASGMAAIAAELETLPVGAPVVVAGDAYSGTRRFLTDVAGRGRLRFQTVDVADTSATLAACSGPHGLLWLESPTNPLLAVADLPALIAGARERGWNVAVDNTFSTPLLQRPLDFGADVVVHSATKWLSGHSDVVLGAAVTRSEEVVAALRNRRSLHGAVAGPWEAWLTLRGVRTLAVRLDRAQANAAELARRLDAHASVTRVRYPGLENDPGHERAAAQMRGFGAMLAFEVRGGAPEAERVATATRLATAATSLGGVETLIERRGRWQGEEALPPNLLRVSVGIEDVEDLWADLDAAIRAGTASA
ncbi:MAG: aminotransferase class I/II-fold pyridoxal phosphate-dependent enzyme [Acidimicrobiaceae bacterium]|nr:aminotransferase class I/II-fold pyridoxal phosphate-dependent enzyme [Acidimicrobiaceae bacterium]